MANEELLPAGNGNLMIDMSQVKDQVGDQLRAFLINMLPKEALDQVIETSWRKLTEPRPELDYNGRPKRDGKTLPSELEAMVTDAMRAELKKRVGEWAAEWAKTSDCETTAGTLLSELVEKAAGGFMRRVASSIVVEAAASLAGQGSVIACGCGRASFRGQSCICGTTNY